MMKFLLTQFYVFFNLKRIFIVTIRSLNYMFHITVFLLFFQFYSHVTGI